MKEGFQIENFTLKIQINKKHYYGSKPKLCQATILVKHYEVLKKVEYKLKVGTNNFDPLVTNITFILMRNTTS